MHLRVRSPGSLTTIQDPGRPGYERFGVPQSGGMDPFALCAANRLVGNPVDVALLEFALDGPALQADADCLVAGTGCGWTLLVGDRPVGLWRAARVFRGETVRLIPQDTPGWGYLAVLGGLDVPLVMGSRSTYLRGGFGGWQGRVLREGDALPVGSERPGDWARLAGRWLPPEFRPLYATCAIVPVVLGPQLDAFTGEARLALLESEYSVSPTSDRMGYRLSGPHLAHRTSADLISEALPWGALQVPADGQPMAMMADRPTTGGYPKIAVTARAGLPLLAQAMPGSGRVRFQAVSVEEARTLYRQQMGWIEHGIEENEDEWAY